MTRRPWEGIVTTREIELYERIGLGRQSPLGKKPAVIIIDVQYRTAGLKGLSGEESRKIFPAACGESAWKAIGHIQRLLEVARPQGVPIFYAYVAPKGEGDQGRLIEKSPAFFTTNEKGCELVEEVAPQGGDYLIPKRHPSAFFGTPLISYLVDRGVDTLLVCGCTTSGCIRATVVDAFSYNFRVAVVEDCVYDRTETSHAINLFDMHSKYAEIIDIDTACRYLQSLPREEARPREAASGNQGDAGVTKDREVTV